MFMWQMLIILKTKLFYLIKVLSIKGSKLLIQISKIANFIICLKSECKQIFDIIIFNQMTTYSNTSNDLNSSLKILSSIFNEIKSKYVIY